MDIKNDYFDKHRLEDMVDEIIIEDEDDDRHLIDMALQLSQQSEGNNRTNTTTNSQHNLTNTIENMDPTFSIFLIPHAKILPPSTTAIFNAMYIINCLVFPDDPPSMHYEMLPGNST